jgi:hypothetical protein
MLGGVSKSTQSRHGVGSPRLPTQPLLTFAGGAQAARSASAGSRRETTRDTPLPAMDTP